MSKSKPKFKIDTVALLNYALTMLKTDRAGLQQKMHRDLQLDSATLLQTRDTPANKQFAGQQLHSRERIWNTPRAAIKTTLYNRIKDVQLHRQVRNLTPRPQHHAEPRYHTSYSAESHAYQEPRAYQDLRAAPPTHQEPRHTPTVQVKRKRNIVKP